MTRITIDKLTFGGAGLARHAGKKLFVPFAAPGDVLDVEIIHDHGSYAEAAVAGIVEAAPCRALPRCPVFGQCGGCQWQHLSYAAQLEWKRLILVETIERIAKVAHPHVVPTLASPREWHYRNRIQLHVDSRGRVGLYKPKSKEVVEFERCHIADEELNRILAEHREEYRSRDRGIALRLASGPHFSQVNTAQNEQVKRIIVECLRRVPHATVIELYAGSGNFTFSIADVAQRVIALEIDGKAVKHAREYAASREIANATFHCLPAHRIRQVFHRGSPDALFLDPPRRGAAESIDAIVDLKPRTILYMSCDPATMARDLGKLIHCGWKLETSLPIDMFPQTYHIESLSLLSRA